MLSQYGDLPDCFAVAKAIEMAPLTKAIPSNQLRVWMTSDEIQQHLAVIPLLADSDILAHRWQRTNRPPSVSYRGFSKWYIRQ
jgi:hypothetical protein